MSNKVLRSPNFFALFKVLFLGAMNDNIFKNGLLVLLTFSGYTIFNLPTAQVVNLTVLLFILPYFLFSSYSGKLADCSSKVKIIRIVKLCEVIIMLIASAGFYFHSMPTLLICLFAMGTHSTVFGPIKYSIVPQYLKREDLVMANGYIELGTFVGILLGQSVGTWFMANNYIMILMVTMFLISLLGYYNSLQLEDVPVISSHGIKFYKNFIKDSWVMYKSVTYDSMVRKNLHAISWFWTFGVIFTTQLPVVTKEYFGGDAHIFSIIMVLFTLGIGFGSVLCAKMSHSRVEHRYVIFGAVGMSAGYVLLLLTHRQIIPSTLHWSEFLFSARGMAIFVVCLFIGIVAGFYSVTCYNELQLISPDEIRSQIISAANILNAAYMVGAAVVSSILLIFMSVWWLLMLTAICNLFFAAIFANSKRSVS